MPAKSFITSTKGHTGYYSYSKCTSRGSNIANTCFPDLHFEKRTNSSFIDLNDEAHHLGRSVLVDIPNFGVVSQIPLDYMHLICIGVVKKLIKMWVIGPAIKTKLSRQVKQNISQYLVDTRNFIPREFVRKPRQIEEFGQWKATELRQFLLYTVILHKKLHSTIYSHFLCLHVAIRLLCEKCTTEGILRTRRSCWNIL